MKKVNTALSIISLFVTSFVLIVVIFAWYVSNSTATVSGITGIVKGREDIVDEVIVYNFSNKSTADGYDTLTIDRYTGDGQSGDVTMKEYEQYSLDQVPTEYLIQIKFTAAADITRLDIRTSSSYFAGYPGTGYVGSATNISLSSVMKYTYLPNVSFINNRVIYETPDNTSFNSFTFNDNTKATDNKVLPVVTNKNGISSIFVLLDYNESYIVDLFTNNIGNDIVELADQLAFKNDFDFMLYGSVVD